MKPFEQCNCMALRRASRRITNFYDSKLAPTGLRVTQYAILALLREHGGVSVNSLARYLDLDRTTMGKNLRPLERLRYVKVTSSATDGRSRTITLTNSGGAALKAAAGLWRRAQAEFESENGGAVVRVLRSTLANLKVGR
jgi:DNA-binding MarR family transcriptional regulator